MTLQTQKAPLVLLSLLIGTSGDLFSQQAGEAGQSVGSAWDVLTKGVGDGDATHRVAAIAATGTIGLMKEAVEMVERGLQDKDMKVRQTAAATLGQMGARQSIPRLKAALADSPEVSFTAAKALWDLGDAEDSREIFQQIIDGERKDAPGKLQGAMREAKHKFSSGQLALMGVTEASSTLLGPASFGITALREAVKEGKKDSSAAGKVISAEILAKDQDAYALILLEWALADDNWAVRVAVAKALGERGNPDSIPKLLRLLSDDRHSVRYMAAASIIKLNQREHSAQ